MGLSPLRQFWRGINREKRDAEELERTKRKVHDKRRAKCRCKAYPWPHRPRGGFCRFPEPPVEQWQRKPRGRPYAARYQGLRRQIARTNGLHPIRDREKINALVDHALTLAKQLKSRCSKLKYRNMKITETGVTGYWTPAGPTM
jgi:hypothetical protein